MTRRAAGLDLALLRLMRTRAHEPSLECAIARFSKLGEHGAVWLATSLAGAVTHPHERRAFLRASGVVVAAYLANQGVKFAVRRPRPILPDLPPLTGTPSNRSYPSSHASTSFAAAAALSGVLPGAPLYALATALTLSRLYLGVHYPSDTAAGAVLGLAVAELTR